MKNHLGTFNNASNKDGATGLHSLDAICEINKHPAILGGNPVRQQLCILDSLLANGNSAGGGWDTRVDRIAMGTFAPTVDYLVATKILAAVMNKPDKNNNVPKFVTNFGYAETDPVWVEFTPGVTPILPDGGTGTGGTGGGGSTSAGGSKASGGSAASGGGSTASNGGTIVTGGDDNGGTTAAGGTTGNGGTASNGGFTSDGGSTSSTGGSTTSVTSASGGSPATGGTSAQPATSAGSAGGSTGTGKTTSATHGTSGSGCDVAGADRRATRWGAMLAFGAVVAARLRRLVSDDDRT
jgi:hypothetical protein